MVNLSEAQITNASLRLSVIASRFLLLLYLQANLSTTEAGYFVLFITSVALFVYVSGWDYYSFSNRSIIQREGVSNKVISSHLILLSISYLIILTLFFIVAPSSAYGFQLFYLFAIIGILEQLTMEGGRYLVAIKKPLIATLSIVIRTSLLFLVYFLLTFFDIYEHSLSLVFYIWILLDFISLSYIAFSINKEQNYKFDFQLKDFLTIREGLAVSILFYLGTLSSRGVFSFDKYFLNNSGMIDLLSTYAIYLGLANMLVVATNTLLIAFVYPKMVEAYKVDKDNYKAYGDEIFTGSVIIPIISMMVIYIVAPYLFGFLEQKSLTEHLDVMWILILGFFINSIGLKFYYELYSAKKDKIIMLINITSSILFFACFYLFSWLEDGVAIYAVSYSIVIYFLSITLMQIYFSKKIKYPW
jgi:O-antigen/teichoic acid export membrane protein